MYMSNGGDGAYIASLDCSTVIQPQTTGTELNGYGIELASRTAGGKSGPITIKTTPSAAGYDGGDINITSGNGGAGSTVGGSITIEPGTGGAYGFGTLFLKNIETGINTTGRYGLQISSTGVVSASASGSSDIRFKNIDSVISNPIDKLSKLEGFYFTWNELAGEIIKQTPNSTDLGLSAQDVEKQFPDIVSEFEAEDGSIYKNVDYIKFVPIFVEAIKEQQNQIEDLKTIVNKQQDQIDKLLELNNLK